MWCPICGVLYGTGLTSCPSCGAGLLASPPPPVDAELVRPDEPRVTVFVGRPDEAVAARDLLRRGGVASALAPSANDAIPEKLAAVVVRSEDLERALEIGGAEEWKHRLIDGGSADGPGSGTSTDETGEALEEAGLESEERDGDFTEHEVQWYFAIARFLLVVFGVVVALIVVSRALT
jgi:hypothetical protein